MTITAPQAGRGNVRSSSVWGVLVRVTAPEAANLAQFKEVPPAVPVVDLK